MKKITPKQKKFADFYIECGNATEAAKRAGYSEKTAYSIGQRLLKNVEVSAYIAKRQQEIESERLCTLKEIQEFRSRVIRGEEKDAFGLDIEISDRLSACNQLEKALAIEEMEKERRKREEEALNRGTYHTDLDVVADTFHSVVRDIRKHGHREYVFEGGRGSTKSSCGTIIPYELMENNHNIHALVIRKVKDTLRDSVYAQMQWSCDKQAENPMFDRDNWKFGLSPLEITYTPTGQKIYFRGADDPGKIKSIKPPFGYIGIVIFEELDQFSGPEEVRNIEQSAIRGGNDAYVFKFFNPPKSNSNWVNIYVKTPKESMCVHHSTYKDVPPEWLGRDFIEEAEHLREVNPDAYEHEYMGVANGNGGMVFDYLELREITDDEIARMDRIYQGVDWGWFPDPYAFIRSYYNPAQEKIYLIAENVVKKTKNTQTGQWIIDHGYDDYEIICDSAEKKSVGDYVDIGLPARPAIKGPGSVEYGMKWLQGKTIVIDQERTPHAYKEFTEYEYERDKDGNVISGYPDADNHTIDAVRYSYEPLWRRSEHKA